MAKNSSGRSTKIKNSTRLYKVIIVCGVVILISAGILGVLSGWRSYRIHQEQPRFIQVEHDMHQAYESVIQNVGVPADAAYVHFCDRPSGEAFEKPKPITCFMDQYFVYNAHDAAAAGPLATSIVAAMHKNRTFLVSRALPERALLFTDKRSESSLRNGAIEGYVDTSVGTAFDCTVSYGYHDWENLREQMPRVYPHLQNISTQHALLVDFGCEAGASREYYPSKN